MHRRRRAALAADLIRNLKFNIIQEAMLAADLLAISQALTTQCLEAFDLIFQSFTGSLFLFEAEPATRVSSTGWLSGS